MNRTILRSQCRVRFKPDTPDGNDRLHMQRQAQRCLLGLLLAGFVSSWSCAAQPKGDLAALRRADIPRGIKDARGRDVSRRALQAYKTSEIRSFEKQYTTTQHALAQLPGVVAVRPGVGVVYVYTTRPAAVPQEFEGVPVTVLPPEFANGISEEWVTPDQLAPPGQGN